MTVATDSPYGRRDFLKDSVVSVAKAAQEFAKHQEAVPEQPAPAPVRTDWLRPPGAADEALFLERCTQCGDCAKVCPYGSITFHPQNGTPVIFADQMPCYLCEDVPCIAACATEALLPVEGRGQIRMGARGPSRTESARQGRGAMPAHRNVPRMPYRWILTCSVFVVTTERCVGCGLCEQVCQTVNDRVAIRVTPFRLLAQSLL